MDWRLNKQTAKHLVLTGVLASMVLISGCATQETPINTKSKLAAEPVVDAQLVKQDFGFPSRWPTLSQGKEIFLSNCAECHAQGTGRKAKSSQLAVFWQTPRVKQDLAYTTPIDLYLMLTTGEAPAVVHPTEQRRQVLPAHHPSFRDKLNRDERWAVIMYARYLAGAGDIQAPAGAGSDVPQIFGGNCAVCHGQRGQADGPLHTGKTGNHELHDAALHNGLNPAPANFQQASRMFNRTDAQLFKYICEGIYPSAMPSWYGDVNVDKDTGKVQYVFNNSLIWNLVRHVRGFTYVNDLDPAVEGPAPAGLQALQNCRPVRTNHPWTKVMHGSAPAAKGGA